MKEKATTVEKSLKDYYALADSERKKLKVITGHSSFGIHDLHDSYSYITLFRNPVKRVVSYYYYILSNSDHYLHDILVKNQMKLHDFVTGKLSVELDNIQTRQLAGAKNIEFGQCDDELLAKAKANLDAFYPVFGITERFDESLILFKNYFGWTFPPFWSTVNASNKSGKDRKPAPEIENYIRQANRYDMELYQYALAKFDKLIADQGPDFKTQVASFMRQNKFIQSLGNGKRKYIVLKGLKWYVNVFKKGAFQEVS